MTFLEELEWRGLLYQTTATDELTAHLAHGSRIGYCGFDPTAKSLTIGNYIPIKILRHFQDAGHQPIVLMGGGTGMIGDPSGRDAERTLQSRELVEAHIEAQRPIFERVLDFDPARPNRAIIVNNADWLTTLSYIDVLRDVGKYFSVNAMIQKDSVRSRLENREQGISYTEFSYMILQAYDFLHLRRTHDCTLQIAGSDQFGNIVAGIDLIRREFGAEHSDAFGVTAPLVTRADGSKIGKTATGAVWLTADMTSPYAFYQYWINVTDDDVIPFLKWFTFLPKDEVDALAEAHAAAPHERAAHRVLAQQMTSLMHGGDALRTVEQATEALFSGDVRRLDADMLRDVFADVPSTTHDRAQLDGVGVELVELLPETSLAKSKREAREFLGNTAVSVNGERVAATYRLTMDDLLHDTTILLRRGRKNWHATQWR